jgi:hypothetical protein
VAEFDVVFGKIEKYGGVLDGELVEEPELGRIVWFRSPDGHMMALRELKGTKDESEGEEEESHPATEEIQRLLKRIKL